MNSQTTSLLATMPPRIDSIISNMSDSSSAGSSFVDVKCVEKAYLEGSFSEALTIANRCLKQQSQSYDNVQALPLLTPLPLKFDVCHKTRYISFHWGEESDSACRAAAIALQSWYELSKQDDSQQQKGHRFLQPFLDTYTSTAPGDVLGRRVMSMELLTLWILFLSASPIVNQTEEAMELAQEVLRHIRSAKKSAISSPISQKSCHELVILLFTELLPSYASSLATQDLLGRLVGPSSASKPSQESKGPSGPELERKDVVQQCLCFCNTDDGNWPHWLQDAFQECRVVLQAELRLMYHHGKKRSTTIGSLDRKQLQSEPSSPRLMMAQQQLSLREIRSWKDATATLSLLFKDQIHRFRMLRIRYSSSDESSMGRMQKIQIVALVLCLTYCWRRHRQRISRIGQKALTAAVWKPALEILEAFGVVRGN